MSCRKQKRFLKFKIILDSICFLLRELFEVARYRVKSVFLLVICWLEHIALVTRRSLENMLEDKDKVLCFFAEVEE